MLEWIGSVTGLITQFIGRMVSKPGSSQGISKSSAGGDIYQAGRDITVNAKSEDTKPVVPWIHRAGGPLFRLNPGISEGRLLCEFTISESSPSPSGVEAKWAGVSTDSDWTVPMKQNTPRGSFYLSYQMKPTKIGETLREDEVTFEVRFNLEDGPHGGKWIWPLHQPEKGHWILDSQKGSGVFQPKIEDIW